MTPASIDIKDIIIKNNLGVFGENLFIGNEPSSPDNCITIYDTGGAISDELDNSEYCTLQIRIRNNNYLNGYKLINDIKFILNYKKPIIINNSKYIGFWLLNNIAFINRDNNKRSIWVLILKY